MNPEDVIRADLWSEEMKHVSERLRNGQAPDFGVLCVIMWRCVEQLLRYYPNIKPTYPPQPHKED